MPVGKKEVLLDKIGGPEALRAAVDLFYAKLVADAALQPYFAGVNIKLLKWHQYNFMSIAFTEIPDDMDVAELIAVKHKRLFDMGLNETHFDIVAGHFVATLTELGVQQPQIDEAVGILGPLRPVFVQGAEQARQRKKVKLLKNVGVVVAAAVAVGVATMRK